MECLRRLFSKHEDKIFQLSLSWTIFFAGASSPLVFVILLARRGREVPHAVVFVFPGTDQPCSAF